MVIITNEKRARNIFKNYENVAAFTLGESAGISDNGLEISYEKLSFLPDDDTINAIINGDMKAKKVIRKAVKGLYHPVDDEDGVCIPMAQLVNIISPEKGINSNRKGGPNIIVFVTDDESDGAAKKREKFLVRYLTALFMQFGIEPVTDKDVIKELFSANGGKKKGKKKAKKMKPKKLRRKIVKRVVRFIDANKSVRLSRNGHILKKSLFAFFSLELHYSGLSRVNLDDVSKKSRKNLAQCLVNIYTNDNLKSICNIGMKHGVEKKMCKKLRKKNRAAVDAYNVMAEIMNNTDPAIELPKVKNGYKSKKGKKAKPKMNTKKFMEFFEKGKNLPILAAVYAHTTCTSMGVDIGSSEYNKYMSAVTSRVAEGYGKSYSAAAKAYAKNKAAAAAEN